MSSLAPWLSVRHPADAVAFYKAAFGAVETYRLEVPDGGLVVRLSVDGAEFWVTNDDDAATLGGDTIRMILTVADPDAAFARAIAAGAMEVYPVTDAHGWRTGRLVDPFGLHWETARPIDRP